MGDLLVEPPLVGGDEGAPRVRLRLTAGPAATKPFGFTSPLLIAWITVEVRQDRPERLHHVERQRRPAEARL